MRRYAATSGAADAARPLVALIGRPNVGKSSLFNRLVGGRPALVEDMPGVTRDRRYGVVDWLAARFRVVDTGGLDPSAVGILGAMRAQTLKAVDEADVLVFVADAVEGLTAVDADVAALLRRTSKPVVLAVNKVDSEKREAAAGEMFALGFDDVFAISASHGRGIGELLDRVVELLGPAAARGDEGQGVGEADDEEDDDDEDAEVAEDPGRAVAVGPAPTPADGADDADAEDDDDEAPGDDDDDKEAPAAPAARPHPRVPEGPIRIAFVGKPNVGKSSLVNRLLGEERVLVHEVAGTTRDPIDTPFSAGGHAFVLVDTAGMRRRRAVETLTEAVAAKMARDQLARCDVAVLVIDAGLGATAEDAKIASLIEESGRATILVLNKKDSVPRAQIDSKIEGVKETFPFLAWAPVLLTSARTGAGVVEIPRAAAKAFGEASRRISTGELNRFLETVVTDNPAPAGMAGRYVRLYFATQVTVCPPTFVFSTNHPTDVPVAYQRFLANRIRRAYGFEGTPIRIVMREHRKKKKRGAAPARE